jgi:hypothetical protein
MLKNRLHNFRNHVIRLLGGADPTYVGYLIHQSSLLASSVPQGKFKESFLPVVLGHKKGVERAISKLAPEHARLRGYYQT